MTYEVELEFGYEIAGTKPSDERMSETFLSSEFALNYALTDQVSAFVEISAESAREKEKGLRASTASFELKQIGIRYAWRNTTLAIGKIEPDFGSAKA